MGIDLVLRVRMAFGVFLPFNLKKPK